MQKPTLELATPTPISQTVVTLIVVFTLGIWILTMSIFGFSWFSKKIKFSQRLNSLLGSLEQTKSSQIVDEIDEKSITTKVFSTDEPTITPLTTIPTQTKVIVPVGKRKSASFRSPVVQYHYQYPTSSVKMDSYVFPTFSPFQTEKSEFSKHVESEQVRMKAEFDKMKAEICAKSPSLCD